MSIRAQFGLSWLKNVFFLIFIEITTCLFLKNLRQFSNGAGTLCTHWKHVVSPRSRVELKRRVKPKRRGCSPRADTRPSQSAAISTEVVAPPRMPRGLHSEPIPHNNVFALPDPHKM